MARTRTVIVCGVCVLAAAPAAWGACRFQNDEIVNPFEAGCGDVMLTYTESDLEHAGKDGLEVSATSRRFLRPVKAGEMVKLPLPRPDEDSRT